MDFASPIAHYTDRRLITTEGIWTVKTFTPVEGFVCSVCIDGAQLELVKSYLTATSTPPRPIPQRCHPGGSPVHSPLFVVECCALSSGKYPVVDSQVVEATVPITAVEKAQDERPPGSSRTGVCLRANQSVVDVEVDC
jgi:hypothetical protein